MTSSGTTSIGNEFISGLQKTRGSHIHARLRGGSTNMFPTECPQKTARSTAYKHKSKIWRKVQYAKEKYSSPLLGKYGKRFIQEVTRILLYYSRSVDCTMIPSLGYTATPQENPIENTIKKVKQFLDDSTTHPGTIFTYLSSDMILALHSDTSYLS